MKLLKIAEKIGPAIGPSRPARKSAGYDPRNSVTAVEFDFGELSRKVISEGLRTPIGESTDANKSKPKWSMGSLMFKIF
jgi:hypothetical protein